MTSEVEVNHWHSKDELPEFIETIKELSEFDNDWDWVQNIECKYVELRIDMRDGGFILKDGNGERISLDELKHQSDWEVEEDD